jgi:hypothetical protein
MSDVEVHIELAGRTRRVGLLRRNKGRRAKLEGRHVRTLTELDYLLGVSDETRLGALRFRWVGEGVFQAPLVDGVPALIITESYCEKRFCPSRDCTRATWRSQT